MKVFTDKFKIGYLFTIGIFAIFILFILIMLWVTLDGYEKSTPDNVAARVFNDYFRVINAKKLIEFGLANLSEFETQENLEARLKRITGDGNRNIRAIHSDEENLKRYVVFSDDNVFAEFEVVRKENTKNGAEWELKEITAALGSLESYEILVTSGSEILINGKKLPLNYNTGSFANNNIADAYDLYTVDGFISRPVVEKQIDNKIRNTLPFYAETNQYSDMRIVTADILDGSRLFINGNLIGEENLIKENITTPETDRLRLAYKRYRIAIGSNTDNRANNSSSANNSSLANNSSSANNSSLELRVENKNGKDGVLTNIGGLNYLQRIVYSEELKNNYETFARDAAMEYVRYMINASSMANIRRYFETGTVLYEILRTSEVYFYTPYIDYRFDKVIASEFFEQEEGVFSFRVTLDYQVRRTVGTYPFLLDATFFLRETGGRYLIFDMIPNG